MATYTSDFLQAGELYSRNQLAEIFEITDATLLTGIFRPKGHDSVWIFITETKTSDRTQYKDRLAGDDLYMDGQTSGRKDNVLIDHESGGLELLLFFRKSKAEHPEYAFRYEGPFAYVSHEGQGPASFHLQRVSAKKRSVGVPETGEAAAGLLHGDKKYQQRAREALPILVRQAKAHRTILYGELAGELGMSNPRTLNWPLGSIGNSMLDLQSRWGRQVPPIQALVVNKSSGLPGEGIAWFAPDAHGFKNASRAERKLIVESMLQEVFTFREWDLVLEELGLSPASVVELPPIGAITPRGGRAEGEEHLELKLALAQHPGWLSLPRRFAPGETEVGLYSGDTVDVLFADPNRRVAAEVKGRSAPRSEVVRGLFQCVKYEAVLNAEARASGARLDCEAVLVLGGNLPESLRWLRNTLQVAVFEAVGT